MSEQRFINLETKILHQELLLEDLHKVIVEQQSRIELLETAFTALAKRLRDPAASENDIGPHNHKPPHY